MRAQRTRQMEGRPQRPTSTGFVCLPVTCRMKKTKIKVQIICMYIVAHDKVRFKLSAVIWDLYSSGISKDIWVGRRPYFPFFYSVRRAR